MDKTTKHVTIMGFVAALVCYGLIWITGCTTPTSTTGWHPKDKKEMMMLVGQTTMQAIDQYRKMMLKHKNTLPKDLSKPKKGPLLDPKKLIDPDLRS